MTELIPGNVIRPVMVSTISSNFSGVRRINVADRDSSAAKRGQIGSVSDRTGGRFVGEGGLDRAPWENGGDGYGWRSKPARRFGCRWTDTRETSATGCDIRAGTEGSVRGPADGGTTRESENSGDGPTVAMPIGSRSGDRTVRDLSKQSEEPTGAREEGEYIRGELYRA